MDSWSRREDRWVGRGRGQVQEVDSGIEIEVVWKIEGACVFGCGWRCRFAESVSGVTGLRLQHRSAFPVPDQIAFSAPTSPRPVSFPTPAPFPLPPISRPIALFIFMSPPSSVP